MGVSIESGGKGGRKTVDSELNLIPFIDLLSVCILFLLMTAVWVQISKMSAFTQPSGQATVTHSEVASINEMREGRDWDVIITLKGIDVIQNQRSLGRFDLAQFREALPQLKQKLANIKEPKVSVRAEDEVIYEDVIAVLDILMTNQLTQVTIGGLQ